MTQPHKLLSIIIPVYNEQATIAEVVNRVWSVELPLDREIIVIDDGSTDSTVEELKSVRGKIKEIHVGERNVGKGFAVRTGLTRAAGDIILIQDADLELDPAEFGRLLDPLLKDGADVVYGSRFLGSNRIPAVRRLANKLLTLATNLLLGTRLTDMGTAYKVFSRSVADSMELRCDRFDIDPEITCEIARNGFEIVEVPITYSPRTRSEGKKIKWHDGIRALVALGRGAYRPRTLPRRSEDIPQP